MLLLDSHIVVDIAAGNRRGTEPFASKRLFVSVATLWELAIKVRVGKLVVSTPIADFENGLEELGCTLLPVTASHAVADVDPWPETNDPFDRLLLAVCRVEGLRLLTRDRKLVSHPLAWRPGSA